MQLHTCCSISITVYGALVGVKCSCLLLFLGKTVWYLSRSSNTQGSSLCFAIILWTFVTSFKISKNMIATQIEFWCETVLQSSKVLKQQQSEAIQSKIYNGNRENKIYNGYRETTLLSSE